jgi:signal transduction histidine kinase
MSGLNLIIFIATLTTLLTLILLVSSRNRKNMLTMGFIFFDLSIFAYIASAFASEIPANKYSLFSTKLAAAFAVFIPLAFYAFSVNYAKIKTSKIQNISALIVTLILASFAFTPYVINQVTRTSVGTVTSGTGPLLWLTLAYFLIMFSVSFKILFDYGKRAEKLVKQQIRVMVTGIGIAVGINLLTQIILPEFHIAQYGVLIGTPALLLLVGSVAYAVVWHRMFDIKAIAFRSLGYLFTLFIVVSAFGIIEIKLDNLFFPQLKLSIIQEIYFVASAVALVFLFPPLQSMTAKITDKFFYRGHYEPDKLISDASKIFSTQIDLVKLCTEFSELIKTEMRIEKASVTVLDNNSVYYIGGDKIDYNLHEYKLYLDYLGKEPLIYDEISEGSPKKIMHNFKFDVFIPLKVQNEIIGYFTLGSKINGTFYDNTDIKNLLLLSNELALSIQNSKAFSLIKNFNVSLQSKIDAATKELSDANAKLKDSDVAKDEFIAMASHQLSTPLAAIDGYVTMAAQGYYGKIDAKLQQKLDAAIERTNVMKGLINDLLNISRMTSGKFHLDMSVNDIQALIETEVDQHKEEAAMKKVTIHYHKPDQQIPKIAFDKVKMQQVVSNFISNAIEYSPEGEVEIFLDFKDDSVSLRVKDNGIGVPEEQKAKLFTKFYRGENAKKIRPDGTGIGLYLAKRVIEDHKGKIIFESEPNKGSTFGFTIPANNSAA